MTKTTRLHDSWHIYRGHQFKVHVYKADGRHGVYRKVSVSEKQGWGNCVEPVKSSVELEPSSILPWRDPEPISMEKQIERAVKTFKERMDEYEQTVNSVDNGSASNAAERVIEE